MMKDQKWRCEVCQFDNVDVIPHCEICQTPRKSKHNSHLKKVDEQLQLKEPGIICPSKQCSFYNLITAQNCVACQKSLFDVGHAIKNSKNHSLSNPKMIYCYLCRFQNDRSNTFCVQCQVSLKKKVLPNNSVAPFGAGIFGAKIPKTHIYCQDCGSQMVQCTTLFTMVRSYNDYACPKCATKNHTSKKLCLFCDKHLEKQQQQFHDKICEQRTNFFDSKNNATFDRCTKRQIQTIYHMHKKYEKHHELPKSLIFQRVKKLGYSHEDLQNLHHYIINYAPIIIHVSFQRNLTYYVKDTHYRNQFEVRGGCSARVQWQDRMFDNMHHSISGYQRVKYGTMNFTNDPQGVNVCVGYGQSYLLLKSHVRDRCTITDMDSSSPTATIATFRFIFHLLMKLSDEQLTAAFEGSKGKQMKSNVIRAYKEIQIHGPVEFSKDVQRVYVCKQQIEVDSENLLNMLKQFCAKNKLEYQIFDKKPNVHFYSGAIKQKVIDAPQRLIQNDKQKQQIQKKLQKSRKGHQIKKSRGKK